jgi:hypothetical protein
MREEDLIEQLAEYMDTIDLDEISIKGKIKEEIERNKRFQMGLLGLKTKAVKVADIDIRNYVKYILRDGEISEKRELLTCLRSRIQMGNKLLKIDSNR